MVVPYHARAPLCRGWMDRASNDCRLLYEIIGPRGRARAIQAPATDSGSNRERKIEKREARADIVATARSHAHHTKRVSTHRFPEAIRSFFNGEAGDGRSDTLSLLTNDESRVTRSRPIARGWESGSTPIDVDKASVSNWRIQFALSFNSSCTAMSFVATCVILRSRAVNNKEKEIERSEFEIDRESVCPIAPRFSRSLSRILDHRPWCRSTASIAKLRRCFLADPGLPQAC